MAFLHPLMPSSLGPSPAYYKLDSPAPIPHIFPNLPLASQLQTPSHTHHIMSCTGETHIKAEPSDAEDAKLTEASEIPNPGSTAGDHSLMVFVRHADLRDNTNTTRKLRSHMHRFPPAEVLEEGAIANPDTRSASDILKGVLTSTDRNWCGSDAVKCRLQLHAGGEVEDSSASEKLPWNVGFIGRMAFQLSDSGGHGATLMPGMTLCKEADTTPVLAWQPHLFHAQGEDEGGEVRALTDTEGRTIAVWGDTSPVRIPRELPWEDMTRVLQTAIEKRTEGWFRTPAGSTSSRLRSF